MRMICIQEDQRLQSLLRRTVAVYDILEGRMRILHALRSRGVAKQPLMSLENDFATLERLCMEGRLMQADFERQCLNLVECFNSARSVEDLGMDPETFVLDWDQAAVSLGRV